MSYDKEQVKDNIEIEDIIEILDFFNAEPIDNGNAIVCRTICHGGDSHKLYYYPEQRLFHCYTGSCGSFDIFELVQKVQNYQDLNKAIFFVVNFLNLQTQLDDDDFERTEDWQIFNRYNKIKEIVPANITEVVLPDFDSKILEHFPQPKIIDWEKEYISKEVCDFMNIRYDPTQGGVLIPHYDINNRLIGIRIRTLLKDQEKYGKYRPWVDNNIRYNHPLAFNLYGIDKAKDNIQQMKTAIVVESEKAVQQMTSYFGTANNICVAVCGSSISKYQFYLLQSLGIKEMVVGFDKDFKELEDEEFNQVVQKLEKIYNKYGSQVNVSFLFDKYGLLDYKSSPLDHGADAFMYLFRNRIIL